MLKNSFLKRDCHAKLFNHNNMIENEISCGTNIVKHRFSKHCSKVKKPTHHPRLLPSKHAKQNSGRARLYSSRGLTGTQLGKMSKSRQKFRFEKFVKMTYHTYACNSLTSFEEEGYTMTGNGNHVTMLKLIYQNS
jgi:hypothetical protein